MKREDLAKYRRRLKADISLVDEAISNGAEMTAEEWFDFNCKGVIANARTLNMRKYGVFNRDAYSLASVVADIVMFLMEIDVKGFKNSSFIKRVKKITSKMNRFVKSNIPAEVMGYDRNGVLYIRVLYGKQNVVTFPIHSKRDAVKCVNALYRYCLENSDGIPLDGEFAKFVKGYVNGEFLKFCKNVNSSPYVSVKRDKTLSDCIKRIQDDDDVLSSKIISIC
jgi:hypothetical protein